MLLAQPDERHANRTACVGSVMTGTEHSTTFSSNEEDHNLRWSIHKATIANEFLL